MDYQPHRFEELIQLANQQAVEDGVHPSHIEQFGYYKVSRPHARCSVVDQPVIWVVVQGQKHCYVGPEQYDYKPGKVWVLFHPLPVEAEVVVATPEEPFLAIGVMIEPSRMADVLTRLDQLDGAIAKPRTPPPSTLYARPLNDRLLDAFIRLLELSADPRDAAMLGDAAVDEVYYRLLGDAEGHGLRHQLRHRGEIQRISLAVTYIHQNLDQPISVERLAGLVYMGQTTFYENFRKVMHMSPLQYAKSVKLHRAQTLLREGRNVSEAGHLVGYSSPAQFSREYKRYFGFAPSAT